MTPPRREMFDAIHPDAPDQWREYLVEWEDRIWPVFQSMGFTKDAALVAYWLNVVSTDVERMASEVVSVLEDGGDPNEGWED